MQLSYVYTNFIQTYLPNFSKESKGTWRKRIAQFQFPRPQVTITTCQAVTGKTCPLLFLLYTLMLTLQVFEKNVNIAHMTFSCWARGVRQCTVVIVTIWHTPFGDIYIKSSAHGNMGQTIESNDSDEQCPEVRSGITSHERQGQTEIYYVRTRSTRNPIIQGGEVNMLVSQPHLNDHLDNSQIAIGQGTITCNNPYSVSISLDPRNPASPILHYTTQD